MRADIVWMLFVSLLSLAALVALLRGTMQIVRGWDAIAGGQR